MQSRICGGGPALHSILLSEGLSYAKGARYDTRLIGGALEPGESSMEEEAARRGVSIEILPEMRRAIDPVLDARAIAKATRMLRETRPEVVHTHTAKAGAVGRTAARLAGVPVVVHTFHGHVFDGYFSARKARAFIAAERALARVTDRILAVSEQQRRALALEYRIAPLDKIQVVPLGLDLDALLDAPDARSNGPLRQSLGIDAKAKVVLAAGRLVPIKRFDLLIDAFEKVLAAHPDAHLLLAGDGELREDLARRARRLSGRVHLLGWRRDLGRIFQEADTLALTSDNEGTPVTVIEALAAGLPVVATRVGGVEDVVGPHDGALVQPGEVDQLARALTTQLESGERLPRGRREEVSHRFSHRRLVADVEALYDELLEQKLRHRSAWGRRGKEVLAC